VNTLSKKLFEIRINLRESIRCERDNLGGRPIVRILRLKPDACGNLRPVGHCFEFAERHLSGVISMLQHMLQRAEGWSISDE
jgi:hypothetical protein